MNPLTQEDLAQAATQGCSNPNCREPHHDLSVFYFHARCHPGATTTYTRYVLATGTIEISCAVCRQPIVAIAVAKRP